MKTHCVLALLLIAAAIAGFLLWPKPTSVRGAKTSTAEPRPPPAPHPGAALANGTGDSLAHAGEMAAFINQFIDSWPPGGGGAVPLLRGIQAIFFASDYIMKGSA